MNNLLIIKQEQDTCRRFKRKLKNIIKSNAFLTFGDVVKDVSKAIYNEAYNKKLNTPYDFETANKIKEFLKGDYLYHKAEQDNHNKSERVSRYRDRIETMILISNKFQLKYIAYFITLTFTDDVLNNTQEHIRRKYVARCLNEFSIYYLANIDYGSENEREHYHAMILVEASNFKNYLYTNENNKRSITTWKQYGYSSIKPVIVPEDSIKLAKYMNKLTNHRFKNNLDINRLIYPKNTKQFMILKRQVKYWEDSFLLFDGDLKVY